LQLGGLPEDITSCDENKLEQVLVSLLANAVEYTEQGSVSLNSSCQKLQNGELLITFSLSDTGVGIPAEYLQTLFDPFSASGANISAKFGGGGLGLPLCKGLVELMGGDMRIESSEGQGTTVSFTFHAELGPADASWQPKEEITQSPVSEHNHDLSLKHPHNILVVDDDEIHRQVVCIHLQKMGYQADEAADGEEAVAAFLQGNYDLVFMDLRMPNMSGTESSRWIREHFIGDGGVRIIALTGDTTADARERCMRAGMDNFVTKPVQQKELEAVLCHNVDHEEWALQSCH
jgi:two-component system, sensor histidine kinase